MTASRVSVLAWAVLVLTVVRYTTALPFDEPAMSFQPVSRSTAENSKNRGFMWVPRKPKQWFPRGRYEGGYDMTFLGPLGVCRMRHEGGVHPGKVFDRWCNVGYGHHEVIGEEFDVLVARRDAFWHMAPDGDMDLSEALTGGREANGQPLKLCVARHRTGWGSFTNYHGYHPGKYVWGRCNFGFADQEISSDDFYLVALGPKAQTKAGAIGVKAARAAPSVDSGTVTADAESPVRAADAGDVDAAAASSVDASKAAAVGGSGPHAGGKNGGEISCLPGEVACHCDKISGCTLPGYCPCPS